LSRLQLVPLSLSSTLFPAMSEREGVKGREQLYSLYMRSINFTILVMMPLSLTLIVFSQPILQFWLGGDFPTKSDLVFKLLAAAAFVQAICFVPLTSLQAMGRPDVTTKYYLAEIPVYIGLCFLLIPWLGVAGAAWAYLVRLIVNALCFLWLAHRTFGSMTVALTPIHKSLAVNLVFFLIMMLIAFAVRHIGWQIAAICIVGIGYMLAIWHVCLDAGERNVVERLISRS
jgi:O-antigen/teichoic acid export membrane protein